MNLGKFEKKQKENIRAEGSFFQTRAYTTPHHIDDASTYLVAVRKNLIAWKILKVVRDQNPDGTASNTTEEFENDLSYFSAVALFSQFETAKEAEGCLIAEPSTETLGPRYFRKFVEIENERSDRGIIFDNSGTPKEAIGGFPAEDGEFDDDILNTSFERAEQPRRKEESTLRRNWAVSTLHDLCPGIKRPLKVSTFLQDIETLGHIEEAIDGAIQMTATLKALQGFFKADKGIPVEEYARKAKVVSSLHNAFNQSALEAGARAAVYEDKHYYQTRGDYRDSGYYLADKHLGRRKEPEPWTYLEQNEIKAALEEGLAGLETDSSFKTLELRKTLRQILSDMSRSDQNINQAYETAESKIRQNISRLEGQADIEDQFNTFLRVSQITYNFFFAKARVSFMRSQRGTQRHNQIEAIQAQVKDIKAQYKDMGATPSELEDLESAVLSPEAPVIPEFIEEFTDSLIRIQAEISQRIGAAVEAEKQYELDLGKKGSNGTTRLRQEQSITSEIMSMLDKAGQEKMSQLKRQAADRASSHRSKW